MTRADLRTLLQRRLAFRTDLATSDFDSYLDQGLLDLATLRMQLRSLEGSSAPISSSAGTISYPIPTGTPPVFAILHLEDTVNKSVLYRFPGGMHDFLIAKQASQSNGVPRFFVEFGANFYVGPQPPDGTSVWTPYIYNRPSMGTDPASVPNIESELHYGIALLGAEHAFRDVGDEDRANNVMQEFQAWIAGRDTPRRMTARHDRPAGGVRPNFSWRNLRTGT